jgi:hypothetical protein
MRTVDDDFGRNLGCSEIRGSLCANAERNPIFGTPAPPAAQTAASPDADVARRDEPSPGADVAHRGEPRPVPSDAEATASARTSDEDQQLLSSGHNTIDHVATQRNASHQRAACCNMVRWPAQMHHREARRNTDTATETGGP